MFASSALYLRCVGRHRPKVADAESNPAHLKSAETPMTRFVFALLSAWSLTAHAAEEPKKVETKKDEPAKKETKKTAVKKPAVKKPPVPLFQDAAAAGPDYAIYGEYTGEIAGKGKLGAHVQVLGEGKFELQFLPGGLPGEGWDGKTREKAGAARDGSAVVTSGAGWTARIEDGKLVGKTPAGDAFALARVIRKSPTEGAKPPEGASVLFDGSNTTQWKNATMTADNLLNCGITGVPTFGDCTVHLEFRIPYGPGHTARGNSGIFVGGFYEIQIMDTFARPSGKHDCASMYSYREPSINMSYPTLSWQTFDIDFRMPRYDSAGKKTENARVTVKHNGVVVHDNCEFPAGTNGRPDGKVPAALQLQNHGSPVVYRNIWVVGK